MDTPTPSRTALRTGWALSGLVVAFLLFDAAAKLMRVPEVLASMDALGLPLGILLPISLVLLACTVLYAVPRTAVLGAVLLTGYLGGAVLTHLRAGQGPETYAFAIGMGVLAWAGLWLREPRLRALLPLRQRIS